MANYNYNHCYLSIKEIVNNLTSASCMLGKHFSLLKSFKLLWMLFTNAELLTSLIADVKKYIHRISISVILDRLVFNK